MTVFAWIIVFLPVIVLIGSMFYFGLKEPNTQPAIRIDATNLETEWRDLRTDVKYLRKVVDRLEEKINGWEGDEVE